MTKQIILTFSDEIEDEINDIEITIEYLLNKEFDIIYNYKEKIYEYNKIEENE